MSKENVCRKVLMITAIFFLLKLTLAKLESITTVKVTNGQSLCDISHEVESNTKIDIIFEANEIELPSPVVFRNLSGISITCSNCTNKRLVCQNGVGLRFEFIQELHIHNLNIEKCSGHHKMNDLGTDISAGVSVSECSNVIIENVIISSSGGTGMIIHNCNAEVMITNSHFVKNGMDYSTTNGGTGLCIIFSNYVARHTSTEHRQLSDHNSNSTYLIQDCTFRDNVAQANENIDSYSHVSGYLRPGRGAGLCLYMVEDSSNNVINITHSQFVNNKGHWGVGMYLRFQDSSIHNQVFITNSNFSQNTCNRNDLDCGGGGVHVSFFKPLLYPNNLKNNTITFINCTFYNNTANVGGGMTIRSSVFIHKVNNKLYFIGCTWSENEAQFGSALDITTYQFNTYHTGYLTEPVFKDCSFTSNKVVDNCIRNNPPVTCRIGQGTVLITGFTLHFVENITVIDNVGAGIELVSSFIEFESNTQATFQNNTGLNGGAISLSGISSLYVKSNTKLYFLNNTSATHGGAISYLMFFHADTTSQGCFVKYQDQSNDTKPVFVFSGNKAGSGENRITGRTFGNTLYVSTLTPCFRNCSTRPSKNTTMEELFNCIGINATLLQTQDDDDQPELGSCIGELKLKTNGSLQIIPGREIDIPIEAFDDFESRDIGIYHISTNNSNIVIDNTSRYISDNKLQLYGKPGNRGILTLIKTFCRRIQAKIEVELVECPPGYVSSHRFNNSLQRCVCGSSTSKSYKGIVRCDESNQALARHGYWVGYHENRKTTEINLVTAVCPQGFCWNDNGSRLYPLPTVPDRDKLDEVVCGPNNRTGIVCGCCTNNHSVFYHSRDFKCGSTDLCHLGWLFYILSELLPTTIFFVIILTLDISFTSGIANGFIFFAQVIDSFATNGNGFIVHSDTHQNTGYKIVTSVYRTLNLDFFTSESMSFCLWKGANALDMIAFKYITVVFAFLLVAGTILFLNKAHCYARFIKPRTLRSSIIHGLSAFLVVCYAQCTRASLALITPVYLSHRNDTKKYDIYVFRGNTSYFSQEHIKYAVLALACLCTIVLVPPLLLITYPLCYKVLALCKLSENKHVNRLVKLVFLEKMKPILDSFQSCYKDNCRFFSGLYFCYRVIVLLTYTFTPNHAFYGILQFELLLILMLHCIAQPYKNKWHNIIDTLIFTNLSLINVMTIIAYSYSSLEETKQNQTAINTIGATQIILISLPLVSIGLYALYHITAKVRHYYGNKQVQSESENDLDEFPARMLEDSNSKDKDTEPFEAEYKQF